MTVDRPNARLTMDVLSPEIKSFTIRDRNQSAIPESFISLNSNQGLTEANFFAVLVPEARPEGGDFGPRPVTKRIDAPGWIGARVERPGGVDFGFFQTGDVAAASSVEGFTTNAKRFTASLNDAGKLIKAYFEGSSFEGRGLSVSSTKPVTCAVAPGELRTEIEVKSEQLTQLSITVKKRPSQVLLKGEMTEDWSYDSTANMLTVRVPEGRHNISIR